jgi:Ca2+-binding RTX toxin-like protein
VGEFADKNVRISLVVDISGSMLDAFLGETLDEPDINNDGRNNTILDATIATLVKLVEDLSTADFGIGDLTLSLVTMGSTGDLVLGADGDADFDISESADLIAKLKGLQGDQAAQTNFEGALLEVESWNGTFETADPVNGVEDEYVTFFVSDGSPTAVDPVDPREFFDVAWDIQDGFEADIISVGVGLSASLAALDIMDNTGGAVIVNTVAELEQELLGAALVGVELTDFRLFIDGVQQGDIDAGDLEERTTGFALNSQTLTGLASRLGENSVVRAEAEFEDGSVVVTENATIDGADSLYLFEDNSLDDVFVGTDGADRLEGGEGDDVLIGLAGQDILIGDAGSDILNGGADNDVLDGGQRADDLDGGEGNDSLTGGAGNDKLRGGAGDDVLEGGAGSDRFIYDEVAWGGDEISDFDNGVDLIDLSASGLTFADLTIIQFGSDTLIGATLGQIRIVGVSATVIDEDDFIF